MTLNPLSVYRLLPGFGDVRTLLFGPSLSSVIRRQIRGSAGEPPASLTAGWGGDPRLPRAEFPSGYPGVPVLSARLAEALGDDPRKAGTLTPVGIEGAAKDGYLFYAVEAVVDRVDARRSAKPKKSTGRMKHTVFRPDALPAGLPAFRVPGFPTGVHWNGWAVERLTELLDERLEPV
ncbi:hypothetical protein ABZZ79_24920 [Streptomyces sp. NPDC006458]|uniref:hypothetical protein n=1 Tax=Streptomyces sp. NPDC006458 TaxID=3154302 RepID=UPI0033AB8687